MTMRSEALWSAEKLATLLQQARGTSGQRWRWERGASTLGLYPYEATYPGALPRRDLLDCGEVLHLVRSAVIEEGWEAVTTLRGDLVNGPMALLEITGERVLDDRDDLFSATKAELTDTDLSSAANVGQDTAMILLRDAAIEHGTSLLAVEEHRVPASRSQADTTWRTVAAGHIPLETPPIGMLSTQEDTVRAHLRAGMASADIQLTAAAVGLEAVPLTEEETAELSSAASEYAPVAFRFGHPRGPRTARPSLGSTSAAGPDVHAPAGIPLQAATEQRAARIEEVAAGRHRR